MRTLRLSLAGTVMLLLGGLGSAVMAQEAMEEAPEGVTYVTGTEACGLRSTSTMTDTAWGGFIRDAVATCEDMMSDPRVSGSWQNTYNEYCYGVGAGHEFCIISGTHVLDGPDGGWECTWTASDFPVEHTPFLIIGVCPGTGDYEGLTYVFQHTGGSFDDGTSFRGAIYEGPPPIGPELEVPAE